MDRLPEKETHNGRKYLIWSPRSDLITKDDYNARIERIVNSIKEVQASNKSAMEMWRERTFEQRSNMSDLRSQSVDILTLGQYLRPSEDHLPIARWYTPDEFASLLGRALGHAEHS